MNRTFIQTHEFSKRWDELGFDDDDLMRLENDIMSDPEKYPIIKGTGGLRKARFAFKNRGKSGSVRVCYVDFLLAETVYLVTVYEKKEKSNLSDREKNDMKNTIEELREYLEGKS